MGLQTKLSYSTRLLALLGDNDDTTERLSIIASEYLYYLIITPITLLIIKLGSCLSRKFARSAYIIVSIVGVGELVLFV